MAQKRLQGRMRNLLRIPSGLQQLRVPQAFSQQNAYVLGDQIIYSLGNMVFAAWLSRHCSGLHFGIYILTQRAMDVMIQISNVLLWSPLVYRLPGTAEEKRGRYRGSVLTLQLFFCVTFTAALLAFARGTRHAAHVEIPSTFAPLVATGGVLLFREFIRRFLFAHRRFQEAFWSDVTTVALQIAGLALFSAAGHLSVPTALVALACGAAPVIPWWLLSDRAEWTVKGADVLPDFLQDFGTGRWFLVTNLAFLVSAQCNPWLLGTLQGGAAVGTYAICESLVNIPRVALAGAENALGPRLATAFLAGGSEAVRAKVQTFRKRLLLGTTLCTLLIWAAAPWISQGLYGKVPAHLRLVTLLLAANLVLYSSTLAQTFGLAALGRPSISAGANVCGLLLQGIVSVALIKQFGIAGAGAALLSGTATAAWVRARGYQSATSTQPQMASTRQKRLGNGTTIIPDRA